MKQELKKHLLPLAVIFVITTIFWVFTKSPWYNFVFLFLGLALGSFFLDLDHVVYWYYLNPLQEESKLARIAISKKDFRAALKLLEFTHKSHTSLIFHHYLFQIILAIVSIFVFSSSANVFGQSFLLALNIHLLADEIDDFLHDPHHLQDWLFARATKQLPISYLKRYLGLFVIATILFIVLLIKSNT